VSKNSQIKSRIFTNLNFELSDSPQSVFVHTVLNKILSLVCVFYAF
jgi:hypothetical protein